MIKLSKLTDYAVVLLTQIAKRSGGLSTASILAQETGLPQPTVSKILKQLAKGGLLLAHRGAAGGYTLATEAKEISVAKIVTVMDGPIKVTDCVHGSTHACESELKCPINGHWNRINTAIHGALENVTLDEMLHDIAPTHYNFISAAE